MALAGVIWRSLRLASAAGLISLAPSVQAQQSTAQIAALQDKARMGSLSAKLELGLAYDLGRGVIEDKARAFAWYLEAAQAGNPTGQFNVAVMLDAGIGVPERDLVGARQWYTRAAANDQPRAQYNLGLLYASGDGVPVNPELSQAWFAQAARVMPAAAAKRAIVPVPEDQAMTPPATAFGTLITLDRARFAELGWTAGRGPANSIFVVEIAVWVSALKDWLLPVYAVQTDVSGISLALPGQSDRYAWRVSRVIPGGSSFASTPWMGLNAAGLALPPDDVAPVLDPVAPDPALSDAGDRHNQTGTR